MTRALPPSMIATHEFVVPRSMPMILAMSCSLSYLGFGRAAGPPMGVADAGDLGPAARAFKRRGARRGSVLARHDHQRGTQQAFVQDIALLAELGYGARRHAWGVGDAHRLVALRIEA